MAVFPQQLHFLTAERFFVILLALYMGLSVLLSVFDFKDQSLATLGIQIQILAFMEVVKL